jgi:hypothetical protein
MTEFDDILDILVKELQDVANIGRWLLVSERCNICFCGKGHEDIDRCNTKK